MLGNILQSLLVQLLVRAKGHSIVDFDLILWLLFFLLGQENFRTILLELFILILNFSLHLKSLELRLFVCEVAIDLLLFFHLLLEGETVFVLVLFNFHFVFHEHLCLLVVLLVATEETA